MYTNLLMYTIIHTIYTLNDIYQYKILFTSLDAFRLCPNYYKLLKRHTAVSSTITTEQTQINSYVLTTFFKYTAKDLLNKIYKYNIMPISI